ncbi:phosphotransferase [Lachnospiraceae bacterium OttesenSCG-928-E19]|nr:phosphotransferase [Lachnospiraceae bacterium OttesenSCG-928-E19]
MSFFLGNLVSCFVPGTNNRRRVRSNMILFFYRSRIKSFVKHAFDEKLVSIKIIRQITLNRVVYLVNDKYYVKVFRNVSQKRLKQFQFLTDYIRPYLSVEIPVVTVSNKHSMYACPAVNAFAIEHFAPADVLKKQGKIKSQVERVIRELQSINVKDIPMYHRYYDSMQKRTIERPTKHEKEVLAHFDLNEGNLFFDHELNISAVIDWDTLSIAKNPATDRHIFAKYWRRYVRRVS